MGPDDQRGGLERHPGRAIAHHAAGAARHPRARRWRSASSGSWISSPVWHAELTGHSPGTPAARARRPRSRQWRPWPGESVTIAVSRPAGVPASTFTIDASQMQLRPGAPVHRGHAARCRCGPAAAASTPSACPPGAKLESLKIGGRDQPPTTDGQQVTLPLQPGRPGDHAGPADPRSAGPGVPHAGRRSGRALGQRGRPGGPERRPLGAAGGRAAPGSGGADVERAGWCWCWSACSWGDHG